MGFKNVAASKVSLYHHFSLSLSPTSVLHFSFIINKATSVGFVHTIACMLYIHSLEHLSMCSALSYMNTVSDQHRLIHPLTATPLFNSLSCTQPVRLIASVDSLCVLL